MENSSGSFSRISSRIDFTCRVCMGVTHQSVVGAWVLYIWMLHISVCVGVSVEIERDSPSPHD